MDILYDSCEAGIKLISPYPSIFSLSFTPARHIPLHYPFLPRTPLNLSLTPQSLILTPIATQPLPLPYPLPLSHPTPFSPLSHPTPYLSPTLSAEELLKAQRCLESSSADSALVQTLTSGGGKHVYFSRK